MPTLLPVPEDVVRVASLALERRAERGGATARGLVIATSLTTGFVTEHEVAEIRDWHDRHPDDIQGGASTLLAGLYGGAPARGTWPPLPPEPPATAAISDPLDVIRTPTAATRTPLRKKLGKLSATVNRSDRQTMLKLHSAATVAFNEALNRAPGWLAGKARTKTARAALEAAAGVYAPAVYAAVGVTEQEFLNRRFDTFAAYAVGVIATAERRKLTAAARALGLDPDAVEAEYGPEIDRRAAAAATMMVASLAILARSALSGHGITAETAVGEFSGPVPFGIVRDALTISSRGASAPAIDETGVGPAAIDELSQRLTDIGSTLVEDLLAANDVRVQVRSTWVHSGNDRPFLPHLDVDGVSWVDTQPPELDWDEGEFPYVSVLQPGDHPGCDCSVEVEYEPYEGDTGDGESALVGASTSDGTPE